MEGRGGIRKQVVECRKCRKGKSVSYDGNAAKELVVSGSIFKEDGVLSSPPLQLPSPCLLTTVHTHTHIDACTRREAHLHNPCSSSLPLVLVELTVDEVEFSPPSPLSLSLSFSSPIFLYLPFSPCLRCTHALRYCFCSLT